MSTEITTVPEIDHATLAKVITGGNLAGLNDKQKTDYYLSVCAATGVNPATRPYEFIQLNGKLTLYARKDCTEQLRKLHSISVQILNREVINDCFIVTARATDPRGRTDESIGAVGMGKALVGEARAIAMMKCETKAKRRVTLSICGLGMLDESEVEDAVNNEQSQTVTDSPAARLKAAQQNQNTPVAGNVGQQQPLPIREPEPASGPVAAVDAEATTAGEEHTHATPPTTAGGASADPATDPAPSEGGQGNSNAGPAAEAKAGPAGQPQRNPTPITRVQVRDALVKRGIKDGAAQIAAVNEFLQSVGVGAFAGLSSEQKALLLDRIEKGGIPSPITKKAA